MNSDARRSDAGQRGSVLVLSLAVVLFVAGFTMAMLQVASAVTSRQGHAVDVKSAFYLAEAGLAEAYTGLSIAKTGNVGTQAAPAVLGQGLYWVEATDLGNEQIQLECTALVGGGRVSLGMAVEREATPLADLGIFCGDSVSIGTASLVDGYDSRLGSYDSQVAAGTNGGLGLLGSNGDIHLNGGGAGTILDGDATPGVGGSVTTNGSVTITGSSAPRPEAGSFPPVEVPAIPIGPGVSHSDAVPYVIPPGESGFDFITIGSNSNLIIQGPATILVRDIKNSSNSDIYLDTTGGPIELIVTESMSMASGGTITCSNEDPTRVTVQIAGDSGAGFKSHMASKTQFFGFFYAPQADLSFTSDFEVFGGIIAQSLSFASQQRLHFDHALRESLAGSNLPEVLSWRVVEIPRSVAGNLGDPFRELGVAREDLRTPAEAHEDQWLVITYVDSSGATRTYEGWESGFDWSDVSEVKAATRDGVAFSSHGPKNAPKGESQPKEIAVKTEAELMDTLVNTNVGGGKLRGDLIDASPLTEQVLVEVARIDGQRLHDQFIVDVMLANSPGLPQSVIDTLKGRSPKMPGGHLNSVLKAQ